MTFLFFFLVLFPSDFFSGIFGLGGVNGGPPVIIRMTTVKSKWNVCEYVYPKPVNFHQFVLVCGPIFEIRCFVQVTAASGNMLRYARP